jgi:hypothetical protein
MLKTALLGWGLTACLSGLALFSLQIAAMPNPVYAEFLNNLDAKMYARHWGTLQTDAFVFDINPPRAITVLGLHAISSSDYGSPNGPPSDAIFLALASDPDPYRLNAARYRYVYLDLPYWRKYGARFEQTCVRSLDKFEETGADGKLSDLRWLVDVSACH